MAEATKGASFPNATTEIKTLSVRVSNTLQQDEPTTPRPVGDPSSLVDMRGKGISKDGYETGSDLNAEKIRMMGKGFTQLEVRLEGSTWTIAIPMDRDLLVNMENMVPSLGLLYFYVEGKTLEKFVDATLSKSIAGLARKVSVLTFNSQVQHFSAPFLLFVSSSFFL